MATWGPVAANSFGGKKQVPDASETHSMLDRAPASAYKLANPYHGRPNAAAAGRKLFLRQCAQCHGENADGGRNAPPLRSGRVMQAPDGVLFWFLKNGNPRAGMPSWSSLPPAQRWQIVSFLKSLQ
ncbi:MAG TPA: c-type cytochrome [Terriglobia bacterium]|nr:c-type cytochrome [Terriglobia bacterium]